MDFYVAKTQEAFQQPYQAYKDLRAGWVEEVKNDPVIGKNLDQVRATVSRAIDSFGDPKLANDFRAAMDLTGAGDHPAFIRAFYKMALALTEGKPATGNQPSRFGQAQPGSRPSAAAALYPNLPSQGG